MVKFAEQLILEKKGGICIITAWACEQNLCLGQLKTSEKSNEKTSIPALIEDLDVKNAIISIDAIGNSLVIAEQIVTKERNYILSLKKIRKTRLNKYQIICEAINNLLKWIKM